MPPRRLQDNTSNDTDTNARDAEYTDVDGGIALADLADDERDFEDEVLSEIDSEADRAIFTLKVYRVGKGVKDQEYCATYSVADFPLIDKIAQDHGGGKYHVMIYKGPRLFRRRHITISATVKPQSSTVAASASASDGAIVAAINALQQVAKDNAIKPQTNALQIVAAFAPFAPVIAAVVNNWRQPDPMAQMTSMVALLKGLKDLSSDETSDREKSPFELMADVLVKSPLVAGLLPQPQPQPQQAQLPPPRPGVVSPEQAQAAMLSQFREQLRMLIGRAQNNSPPELYADLLDDMLPDDLKRLLKQPGSYQFLENIEPAIATYRPWFEAVLQAFRSPPVDDDEEDGPPENIVDTSSPAVAGVNDAHTAPIAPHLSRIVAGWNGGDTGNAAHDGEDSTT